MNSITVFKLTSHYLLFNSEFEYETIYSRVHADLLRFGKSQKFCRLLYFQVNARYQTSAKPRGVRTFARFNFRLARKESAQYRCREAADHENVGGCTLRFRPQLPTGCIVLAELSTVFTKTHSYHKELNLLCRFHVNESVVYTRHCFLSTYFQLEIGRVLVTLGKFINLLLVNKDLLKPETNLFQASSQFGY